jgi:hypothetical protein
MVELKNPKNLGGAITDVTELRERLNQQAALYERDMGETEALLMREAAAALSRLSAERMKHIDYGIDLQRIIEALCKGREIPVPETTARYHYDMAVAAKARSESALAEAQRERDEWEQRCIDMLEPTDDEQIAAMPRWPAYAELTQTLKATERAEKAESALAEWQGLLRDERERAEKAEASLSEAQYRAYVAGRERDEAHGSLADIAAAIGTVEFMDPPDGGDVTLAEQVQRMRVALADLRDEFSMLSRSAEARIAELESEVARVDNAWTKSRASAADAGMALRAAAAGMAKKQKV